MGIGILISAILMNISYKSQLKFNIETKAREMGMVYPEELKIGDLEEEE